MERIEHRNGVATSVPDADELWAATGPSAIRLATVLPEVAAVRVDDGGALIIPIR